MWGIILSREYSTFFKKSMSIGYEDRLEEIIEIIGKGAGLIKAIINFFITQDNRKVHRITLIQLLETIAHSTDDRQIETSITAINKSKEKLESFNIFFKSVKKDKYFEYHGATGINFLPALTEKKEEK